MNGINLIFETRVWVIIFVWIWFSTLFYIWFYLIFPIWSWPLDMHVHALAVAMHGTCTYTYTSLSLAHVRNQYIVLHRSIQFLLSSFLFFSIPLQLDQSRLQRPDALAQRSSHTNPAAHPIRSLVQPAERRRARAASLRLPARSQQKRQLLPETASAIASPRPT